MTASVTELKVYVPAENFAESQQFYRDLGFELTEAWGGNFDCRLGNTVFRLQNYYVKDWAENLMLQFETPDASAWYDRVKPIIESGRYKDARVGTPEVFDGATIVHVHDPCGVLLIFIQ